MMKSLTNPGLFTVKNMYKQLVKNTKWSLLMLMLIAACAPTKGLPEHPHDSTVLISSEFITLLKRSEIKNMAASILPDVVDAVAYDVNVYRVTYQIKQSQSTIKASGLIAVPAGGSALPILSYQHGAMLDGTLAPSLFNYKIPGYDLMPLIMTSLGYVTASPDYIGYGVSAPLKHPFVHAETLGSATVNMIFASKQFTRQKHIKHNDQLFLMGYSEGGYATMASHKLIDESYHGQLKVTASSCGGGPYDVTGTTRYIAKLSGNLTSTAASFYALLPLSYNQVYQLNRPLEMIFTKKNAVILAEDPIRFQDLSPNPADLFSPIFRKDLLTGADSTFMKVVKDNDVYDWVASAPIFLFHELNDEIIPADNARTAYHFMKYKGGSVTLSLRYETGHSEGLIPFTSESVLFFRQFQGKKAAVIQNLQIARP